MARARPPPRRHRDADLLHPHLARGQGRLDVARDRLRLGPLVGPAPEADPGRRARRPAAGPRRRARTGRRPHVRRRADHPRSASSAPGSPPAAPSAWRAQAEAAPQRARAWSSSQESTAVSAPRAPAPRSARARRGRRPRARRRSDAGSASRRPRPARAARRAVWSARALRRCRPSRRQRAASRRAARRSRRTRAPGPPSRAPTRLLARLLLRPASEPLRRHPGGLERVDPVDDPGQQPSRVPADLVPAQGQLVDPVQQHREPLGGAERLEERVELRLGGVLPQQPRRGDGVRVDDQLLVGSLDRLLGAGPDPVRRGDRAGQGKRSAAPRRPAGRACAPGPPSARSPPRPAPAAAPDRGRPQPPAVRSARAPRGRAARPSNFRLVHPSAAQRPTANLARVGARD